MSAPQTDTAYTKLLDTPTPLTAEAWMKKHGNGSEVYISYDLNHAELAIQAGCDVWLFDTSGTLVLLKYAYLRDGQMRFAGTHTEPCCYGMCSVNINDYEYVTQYVRRFVIAAPNTRSRVLFDMFPHALRIEREIVKKDA